MLLAPRLALPLSVLLGGVLLHSMNVLITATLLPSIVADVGGANLMSWPTTAFLASSIAAATATGIVSSAVEIDERSAAAPWSMPPAPSYVRWRHRLAS